MSINDPAGMFTLVSDAALFVMLGTVSYQCIRAARRTASLREDKQEMSRLLDKVGEQVGEASLRIQDLNRMSSDILPRLMDAVERAERLAPDLKMVSDSGGRIADRIEALAQEGRKAQAQMTGLLEVWDERQAFLRDLLARTEAVPAAASSPVTQSVSQQPLLPQQTAPERPLPGTAEEREVADLVSEALASIDAEQQGLKPIVMVDLESSLVKQAADAMADDAPAVRVHDLQDAVAAARSSEYASPVEHRPATASSAEETRDEETRAEETKAGAPRAEPTLRAVASAAQDVVAPDAVGRRTGDDLLSFIRRRI